MHAYACIPIFCAPPELKVRTPPHTKYLGWCLEFEFRVTQGRDAAAIAELLRGPDPAEPVDGVLPNQRDDMQVD